MQVNKEKKAESEHMQAQHATVKRNLSAAERKAEQLSKELSTAKARIQEQTKEVQDASNDRAALSDVSKRIAAMHGTGSSASATASRGIQHSSLPEQVRPCARQDSINGTSGDLSARHAIGAQTWHGAESVIRVTSALRLTRAWLQVTALIATASEVVKLRAEVERLSASTQQAAQARSVTESQALQRLQAELSSAIADTAAAQDRLQTVEAELLRVQRQGKSERAALQAQIARKEADLLDLPKLDQAAWPAPVVELVSVQVQAAVSAAVSELHVGTAGSLTRIEAERDAAVAEQDVLRRRVDELASDLAAVQERAQQLEREARAQASTLQARVRELSVALQAADAAEGAGDESAGERDALADARARADAVAAQLSNTRGELDALRTQTVQQMWERERSGSAADTHVPKASVSEISKAPPLATTPSDADANAPEAALSAGGATGYWRTQCNDALDRVASLETEVATIQRALGDERHAHELRSLADGAVKDEIAELRAQTGRSSVDVEYLKNVLLGFFESGELPANETVVSVLQRLLHFTERDRARLAGLKRKGGRGPRTPASSKARSGTFGLFG